VIIGPIKLTNFLLDQQLQALEQAFRKDGGLCKAMTRARLARRNSQRRGP
jgi:four helix bundle suffix protein